MVNNKLFIGGIPRDMDEIEFQELFSEYGTVIAVNILRSKGSKISRRFGFVELATVEDAKKIISLLHGGSIDGQEISVRPVIPGLKEKRKLERKRVLKARKPKQYQIAASSRVSSHTGKRPRIKKY